MSFVSTPPASRAGVALLCAVIAPAAIAALAPATARGTEFYVNGGIVRGLPPVIVLDSYEATNPVQIGRVVNHDEFGPNQPSWHAQADSVADIGGVRAHTFASLFKTSDASILRGGVYNANAFARATFTDFIIPGPVGTTVTAALRFHVHGTQDQGTTAGTDGRHLSVNTSVMVNFSTPNGSDGGFHTLNVTDGVPAAPYEGGMMTGFDGDDTLVTMPFVFPVGEFFTVRMDLTALTNLNYNSDEPTFQMQGNLDFGGTVSFATDGPVFLLPDGFTVNSLSAGIVENAYIVPAPGAALTLMLGLAPLNARRRRT